MATTTPATTAQIREEDISTFSAAKRKLLARVAQLNSLRARAVAANNTKLVVALDADIKEANALRGQVAAIDTMLAPFLNAWEWAKQAVGLGELGLIWVPIAVTAGIAAVVYAIRVFDTKMETASDRYEAELKAVQAWKDQGLTTPDAIAQVNKTGVQIAEKDKGEAEKPGFFENLDKYAKVGGFIVLAGIAWKVYEHMNKPGRKAAAS